MQNQGVSGMNYGEKIIQRGIIGLVLVCLLKLAAGIMSGATVLMADALSTGSDIIRLIGSYVGLKLSNRGAEGGFKYGYYKVDTFIAFLIAASMVYFGGEILISSIQNFNKVPSITDPYITIGVGIFSIALSINYANVLKKTAEESHVISLEMNARGRQIRIIMSFAVLAAVIASLYHLQYVEASIGILISLVILKFGIESIKASVFYLLDYWNDPELVAKIETTIQKNAKIVTEIKKIRLRRAGAWIFGEIYLEIPSFVDARNIRTEIAHLQEKVHEIDPFIKDIVIYFKIPKPSKIQVAIPVKDKNGLDAEVAMNEKDMKYYLIVDVHEKEADNERFFEVEMKTPDSVTKIAKILEKQEVEIVINNNMNSLLYYTLQHIHHIQLYPTFPNIKTARDTIKLLVIDT